VTLKRPQAQFELPTPRQPQKLPQILAPEEVVRLIECADNPKHRAILMTTYAAGLRLSEVTHLKVSNIDGTRMTIHVEQGKGAQDRYTPLSPRLLTELRRYWCVYHPKQWLFPGTRKPDLPILPHTVQRLFHRAKARAGITKDCGIHGLRHAFATHLLEAGVDVPTIQHVMGHGHISSTLRYFHLARKRLGAARSPLDLLPRPEPMRR
jgi:integrase/recombinase XerD